MTRTMILTVSSLDKMKPGMRMWALRLPDKMKPLTRMRWWIMRMLDKMKPQRRETWRRMSLQNRTRRWKPAGALSLQKMPSVCVCKVCGYFTEVQNGHIRVSMVTTSD